MATRIVTIRPGEKVILPKGASITTLVTTGSINVESTCDNLPTPEAMTCYSINWSIGDSDGDDVFDENDTVLESITVGSTEYTLNVGNAQNENYIYNVLSSVVNDGSIEWCGYTIINNDNQREDLQIKLKTAPSIAATIKLKWQTAEFLGGLITGVVEDTGCCE